MAEEKSQSPEEKTSPETEKEEKPVDEIAEMTTLQERTLAALSYVGFFAIVPFYLKKESKFCRFHGKQGMLVALIFFFAKLLLVLDIFMDIALILQFVIFLKMGFAALSGKWSKLPWIYNAACQLENNLSLEAKEEEVEREKAVSGKE